MKWTMFEQLQTGIKFLNEEEITFWTLEKKFWEGRVLLLWRRVLKGRVGPCFPVQLKLEPTNCKKVIKRRNLASGGRRAETSFVAGLYLKFVCFMSFVCNPTADISKAPFPSVYLEISNGSKSVRAHLVWFIIFCLPPAHRTL